jgi:DNA-binding MarR family transcriptional regulator
VALPIGTFRQLSQPTIPVHADARMRVGCAMTLTILYRHHDRSDEVAMTMISTQEEVAAMVKQLEKRGFVVDKITARFRCGRAGFPLGITRSLIGS